MSDLGAHDAPLDLRPGSAVDRYKLLEQIGEGGMGSVWMAEQREPVQRRVALKVVKLGMDTREVVARFEAERQALALMEHPHIAKVLDGGATDSGRPYFVMELVRGTPITDYCDAARLGLRERLELFTKVCRAVQHAHQKGVIHRDLKPSNVLVTLHDGTPVPKVIDFGIAKATHAELTRGTLFTQYAQMLGTPEYMAPEQAELSGLDVDTRADVYSLGVLLYELLTGTQPFDLRGVAERGHAELLRTIREDEPVRPSTRVSTAGEQASPIAVARQVDVGSLGKRLRGDLDWVVMKALEKDRARRYETAEGFAADVARYLRDEPVVAAPPSEAYRLRKLVRRRKATVVVVVGLAILLVAGSVGSGIGWWTTRRANAALSVALDEKGAAIVEQGRQGRLARTNETRARRAAADADARAVELEEVARFQARQLSDVDPWRMGVRLRDALIESAAADRRDALTEQLAGLNFTDLALRALEENVFERSLAAIDSQFADQPLVQALLLGAVAETLRTLGLLDMAAEPSARALSIRRHELGDDDPDTLGASYNLGLLLRSQRRLPQAEAQLRAALEGQRRVLGDEHPDTLASLSGVGTVLHQQGRWQEAEAVIREALRGQRRTLGDEDQSTLGSLANLGFVLGRQGKLTEAESLQREALEGRRRTLGDEHQLTLTVLNNFALDLRDRGRLAEAETLFREAFEGYRRSLGDEDARTFLPLFNLARLCEEQGRLAEAETQHREALEGRRRVLGDDHPATLRSLHELGALLLKLGRRAEAEGCFREGLELHRRAFGQDHPGTLSLMDGLRQVLEQAASAAREDGDDAARGSALAEIGALRLAREEHEEAEAVLAEALQVLVRATQDERLVQRVQSDLGATLAARGRHGEAEPLLLESAEWMLDRPTDPAAEITLERVVELYDAWHAQEPDRGYDASADPWREELAAWRD